MIPESVLDAIKQQADLVRVIGDEVPLRAAGREHKALCPFHEERTPSFYVVPDKEFWKCFGCGKSGDVIDFVALRRGVTRDVAARELVTQLKIEVPPTAPTDWGYKSMEPVRAFLRSAGAEVLARLLAGAFYRLAQRARLDFFGFGAPSESLEIVTPFAEVVTALPDFDKERILLAVASVDRAFPDRLPAAALFAEPSDDAPAPEDQLVADLVLQRQVMIDVATGGPRINDVNDQYRARNKRIQGTLAASSTPYPNPHPDLWDWYNHWRREGWGSWAERRSYVEGLFDPLLAAVVGLEEWDLVPQREPTGWIKVDRVLTKARQRLTATGDEEDYQSVGLFCREVLISLAQAVYDPELHPSPDGVVPSDTDAERMLGAFLAAVAKGHSNEAIRRHAKASLQLSLELHHKRTADFRAAALCLEAASSTVNVVAILAGRREPPAKGLA